MKIYLRNYIKEIDNLLNSKNKITNDDIEKHLIKIGFFQHERLIHLLVTLFYALIATIFMAIGFIYHMFFIISTTLFVFLMFYIVHYFRLENGVQYLYKQYDKMLKEMESDKK